MRVARRLGIEMNCEKSSLAAFCPTQFLLPFGSRFVSLPLLFHRVSFLKHLNVPPALQL
jgi:hypothetical protein